MAAPTGNPYPRDFDLRTWYCARDRTGPESVVDSQGRTFYTIVEDFTDVQLEQVHDYIQLLFPLPWNSRSANKDVVMRTGQFGWLACPRRGKVFRQQMRMALTRLLAMWNLEFTPAEVERHNSDNKHRIHRKKKGRGAQEGFRPRRIRVVSALPPGDAGYAEYMSREAARKKLMQPVNHNHRRISRMIRSLRLARLPSEAASLYRYFRRFAMDHPQISRRSVDLWGIAANSPNMTVEVQIPDTLDLTDEGRRLMLRGAHSEGSMSGDDAGGGGQDEDGDEGGQGQDGDAGGQVQDEEEGGQVQDEEEGGQEHEEEGGEIPRTTSDPSTALPGTAARPAIIALPASIAPPGTAASRARRAGVRQVTEYRNRFDATELLLELRLPDGTWQGEYGDPRRMTSQELGAWTDDLAERIASYNQEIADGLRSPGGTLIEDKEDEPADEPADEDDQANSDPSTALDIDDRPAGAHRVREYRERFDDIEDLLRLRLPDGTWQGDYGDPRDMTVYDLRMWEVDLTQGLADYNQEIADGLRTPGGELIEDEEDGPADEQGDEPADEDDQENPDPSTALPDADDRPASARRIREYRVRFDASENLLELRLPDGTWQGAYDDPRGMTLRDLREWEADLLQGVADFNQEIVDGLRTPGGRLIEDEEDGRADEPADEDDQEPEGGAEAEAEAVEVDDATRARRQGHARSYGPSEMSWCIRSLDGTWNGWGKDPQHMDIAELDAWQAQGNWSKSMKAFGEEIKGGLRSPGGKWIVEDEEGEGEGDGQEGEGGDVEDDGEDKEDEEDAAGDDEMANPDDNEDGGHTSDEDPPVDDGSDSSNGSDDDPPLDKPGTGVNGGGDDDDDGSDEDSHISEPDTEPEAQDARDSVSPEAEEAAQLRSQRRKRDAAAEEDGGRSQGKKHKRV